MNVGHRANLRTHSRRSIFRLPETATFLYHPNVAQITQNTDLEEIGQKYAGGQALLEATTNYFYIYDMLSEYLDVVVGHPPKLKAIAQTDKKTDRIDAKELSRLLWLGSVPESYVPTGEIREYRALSGLRKN